MPSLIRTKSGIYYVVSYVEGKQVWRSTRTRNRSEAYKVFLDHKTEPEPKEEKYSLKEAISQYLEHVKTNHSHRTFQLYEYALSNLLRFAGDVSIQGVDTYLLDRHKIARAKQVSPSTVNIEIRTFRSFFHTLIKWGRIEVNPCDHITQLRITEQLPAYLAQEPLGKLVESIGDPWLRDIVRFTAMTGLRLGELLNLRWEDVDVSKRVILVRSSHIYRVKSGKMRTVPLNDEAFETVRGRVCESGLVFPGMRGERANSNFVSSKFRKAIRAAGLDRRLHFHSLRHTFASALVEKGVSLYQVQKLLGHSSPRVTEMYSHLAGSDLHSAVSKIACSIKM